jgi:hypothetical protein
MNVESNNISELTTTFWKMAFDKLPVPGTAERLAAASP